MPSAISLKQASTIAEMRTNLVRKWREGRGLKRVGLVAPTSPRVVTPTPLIAGDARFVPIGVAAPAEPARANSPERVDLPAVAPSVIEIELRRGSLHLNVRWPSAAAGDCLPWLRELTSAPSK